MTKIADKIQNLNDSYVNAHQREGIYNIPGEPNINEIKQTLSNRKLEWNARLDFLESKINTGDVKYLSSLKDILSQYKYLNSNRVANADIVKTKLERINETIKSLEKKQYDASWDDLNQVRETANQIQGLYNSYKEQIPRNRVFLEDTIKNLSDEKSTLNEKVAYFQSSITKYSGSLGAAELKYLIDAVNILFQSKLADRENVKDNIAMLKDQLERTHKVVSYDEAQEDLEQKADVVQIPTATTQYAPKSRWVLGKAGKTIDQALKWVVVGAFSLIVGTGLGTYLQQPKINTLQNKITQMGEAQKDYSEREQNYKNEINCLEKQVENLKEVQTAKNILEKEIASKKTETPKQAAQEQKAKLPEIPVQGGKDLKTNFTFGHEIEDTLKLYSPKERYAMERIATAMDYKDLNKVIRSLTSAEKAVHASENQTLISFYDGHLALLLQSQKEVKEQKPMSDDEKYKMFFNTIPPSQQPASNTETKDKSLEAKVKQEEKGKKTVWQKTGDVIWDYTPISLVSVREWKRHPFRQTIKLVAAYFTGKGFGWWGKHAGEGVAAGGVEIVNPGGG